MSEQTYPLSELLNVKRRLTARGAAWLAEVAEWTAAREPPGEGPERPGTLCICQPEVDADEPAAPATHFARTCGVCETQWWALHCPHDGYQNTCPHCGQRPEPCHE